MKKIILISILCIAISYLGMASNFEKYEEFIIEICRESDVPPEIMIAIITVESNWKNIRGYTGDIGLCQLNPRYINYYEDKFWNKETFDVWNEYHNIEIAVSYLKWLYDQTNDWDKAIRAYNIGLTALRENRYIEQGNRYLIKVIKVLNGM